MEPHEHIELIDSLLVEATRQIEALEQTMSAQQKLGIEGSSNAPGTFYHPAPYTLQEEHAWWKKAHDALTMVRNAFEQIEYSKRQRASSAESSSRNHGTEEKSL
jgi:hypothetical protein